MGAKRGLEIVALFFAICGVVIWAGYSGTTPGLLRELGVAVAGLAIAPVFPGAGV